jgi:hypothetical protein
LLISRRTMLSSSCIPVSRLCAEPGVETARRR